MVQFDGYCNCETRKQGETPLGPRRFISMPDLGLLQCGGEDANTVQYIPHVVRCAGALSLTCGMSSAPYRLSNVRFRSIDNAMRWFIMFLVLKVTE